MSRGRRAWDPVLECWTTLTATAARTSHLHVGSFVANVMNRHPALLARMAATLQEQSGGRVDLGLGSGGYAREMTALGMLMPDRDERHTRLREALEIVRLLSGGGPVDYAGRYYRLERAWSRPAPQPPARLIVAGLGPEGTRLAAEAGDGWTCDGTRFAALLPVFEDALGAADRRREDVVTIVSSELGSDLSGRSDPLLVDLAGEAQRWRELGADELILARVRPAQLPVLLAAAERAGLA